MTMGDEAPAIEVLMVEAPAFDAPQAFEARLELERLAALALEERARALAETVRRLEAELDATEAAERAGQARTSPARR